jgi:hypothetical protein
MTDYTQTEQTDKLDQLKADIIRLETPRRKPNLGVFVGNNASDRLLFETFLGRSTDYLLMFMADQDYSAPYDHAQAYIDSVQYECGRHTAFTGTFVWSLHLYYVGRTLAEVANGDLYAEHQLLASKLLQYDVYSTDKIHVRVAQEFNGNWFGYNCIGRVTTFINAWKQFVDAFRSVSGGDRFVFHWCPNIGQSVDLEAAYPGASYVDVHAMDFYAASASHASNTWNTFVSQTWGLQWNEDFAAANGKPTAYTEWGVQQANAQVYIAQMAKWCAEHPVMYHCYWDSNSGFPGLISDGSKGATGDMYIKCFG